MKVNQQTVLISTNLVLVPYARHHVPTYHNWMLDEELRELTASEPLTLSEEYEMQQKWAEDEDKLTFIILARPKNDSAEASSTWLDIELSPSPLPDDPRLRDLPMIGDVNMFLKGEPSHVDDDTEDDFEAEAEIMIAEPAYRRKGLAKEALRLFLSYATGEPTSAFGSETTDGRSALSSAGLASSSSDGSDRSPLPVPTKALVVKISQSNAPSIRLFEALGFHIVKVVAVFEEVEMRWGRARDGEKQS